MTHAVISSHILPNLRYVVMVFLKIKARITYAVVEKRIPQKLIFAALVFSTAKVQTMDAVATKRILPNLRYAVLVVFKTKFLEVFLGTHVVVGQRIRLNGIFAVLVVSTSSSSKMAVAMEKPIPPFIRFAVLVGFGTLRL